MAGNSLTQDLTPLATAAQEAKSILICIHPQSTYDAVAAALAWKITWEQAEKSVTVLCSAPMRAEYERLFELGSVVSEAGNRDLVMSFPYDDTIVDKVSYNVNEDTNQFELIISPKTGFMPLSPKQIQFRQAGVAADLVVMFGFHAVQELGELYEKEKYTFDQAFSVAVTQSKVPTFAKFHITLQNEQLSYSEWTYYVLRQLQIGNLTEQAASNLLQGIEYATDRLMAVQNARTFETVAQLLRGRARRMPDNPAFAALATPIEEPTAQWEPVEEYSQQTEQNKPATAYELPDAEELGVDMTPVQSRQRPQQRAQQGRNPGVPQLVRGKRTKPAQNQQPSEFAGAMGSRS